MHLANTFLQLSTLYGDRRRTVLDAVIRDPIAGDQPMRESGLQHSPARWPWRQEISVIAAGMLPVPLLGCTRHQGAPCLLLRWCRKLD